MAIYLDSAMLEEARLARDLGWVHGVTTNPALMAKAGTPPETVLRELAQLRFHHVFYQLTSQDMDQMLLEAQTASKLVSNLILKIAPTPSGFRFVAKYGGEFSCCVTAIFDPSQALVARAAGARYIAVYVNRATKQLGDGLSLVTSLANVLAGSETQILAASLKSTKEAVDASLAGAQHITVPFELLTSLSEHPLSRQTIEQFDVEGVGITVDS